MHKHKNVVGLPKMSNKILSINMQLAKIHKPFVWPYRNFNESFRVTDKSNAQPTHSPVKMINLFKTPFTSTPILKEFTILYNGLYQMQYSCQTFF